MNRGEGERGKGRKGGGKEGRRGGRGEERKGGGEEVRTVGREGAHDVGDYGPHMKPSDKSCSNKHWVSCMSTLASQVEIERENFPDADKLCLPILSSDLQSLL